MKIILSNYACDPYRGSEFSVGWKWIMYNEKNKNQTYVITRLKNKKKIN